MSKLKYLIVENATDVCEGIIRRMEAHNKWEALPYAVSPVEAIETIEKNKPELIFLDWSLNGGSAYELLEYIKQADGYDPYIIFNTGYQKDNPEIPQVVFNQYKIDKYIVKPIWENLRNNLALYLKEAKAKASEQKHDDKKVWIEDVSGKKILIDLNDLVCICQHPGQQRWRNFFDINNQREISVALQWIKCLEMLQQFNIDHFITKARAHLVTRTHVESFDRPFVRFKNFNSFKVEVVRENVKAFEQWLTRVKP